MLIAPIGVARARLRHTLSLPPRKRRAIPPTQSAASVLISGISGPRASQPTPLLTNFDDVVDNYPHCFWRNVQRTRAEEILNGHLPQAKPKRSYCHQSESPETTRWISCQASAPTVSLTICSPACNTWSTLSCPAKRASCMASIHSCSRLS